MTMSDLSRGGAGEQSVHLVADTVQLVDERRRVAVSGPRRDRLCGPLQRPKLLTATFYLPFPRLQQPTASHRHPAQYKPNSITLASS